MSTGKRTKVPAALHSELSEYSSLLRALRTSNTLDLSSQLTAHATTQPADADLDADELVSPIDDEGESERPPTETRSEVHNDNEDETSDLNHFSRTRAARKKYAVKGKGPRDTWTRWPLLAGDVHVPEWSLEDEVKLLAIQALQSEHSSPPDTDSEQEDVDDALLSPIALRAVTESSGRFLSEMLALLAAHVPPSGGGMQNRVRPMSWESVLTISASAGLISPECVIRHSPSAPGFDACVRTLQTVRQRLHDVYPSSNESASTNIFAFMSAVCSFVLVIHNYPQASTPTRPTFDFLVIDGYDPSVSIPGLLGPWLSPVFILIKPIGPDSESFLAC